jgi:hypothetical protein
MQATLIYLEKGIPMCRRSWESGRFVFKQIPAEIGADIIPKMQSVPEKVKKIMLHRNQTLKYTNQLAMVDADGHVTSWSPNADDLFADDWQVFEYIIL